MDWTKKYSDAEIEKRQEEYIKEALLMAKRAVPDEAESTDDLPDEVEENIPDDAGSDPESEEASETPENSPGPEEKEEVAPDEELTKFLDSEENDEQNYIEVKSDLERLIDRISEGKGTEEKPLCNCPACRKKRAGK